MGAEIVNVVPDLAPSAAAWVVVALGVGVLVSAIVAITSLTALATALSMVGAGLCLAGLLAGLSWHFLGAVLVMLWAGGLLAFFVFGVILLNRDDSDPVALRGLVTRVVALGASFAALYFVVRHASFIQWPLTLASPGADSAGVSSTLVVGQSLFGELGFPVQMLAVGLLLVVLAALSLTRVAAADRK